MIEFRSQFRLYNLSSRYSEHHMKSISALTPNTSRDQMLPGRIYMHFLPEKNLHWPVRLVDISRQKSRTLPKATFEVISGSLGTYKFANHKIQLPLNSQSLEALVPFESVYSDKNTIQLAIEDGSLSQKNSKEYTAAMSQAAKAFENQLKTPAMYQLLKANDKKSSSRNNQANNLDQFTRLGPFFNQILNNRHAPQKVTFKPRSSSKPLPLPIPKISDPNLSSNLQSVSSISSSHKYAEFTNDLKRFHSKTKIDQNSIQSLQCIKKKRNTKNNTSSIEFQAESSSSISKLSQKSSSKMLTQKNSLQSQSYQRNKSSKSTNTKDKPKKVKIQNDQFNDKKEKLSAKQSNHIKKVQTKKQEPLRIAKTQTILNRITLNLKTAIQQPNITTNVQNSIKILPNDAIFEIQKCEFQNSRVSSRTRSKKISNAPINIQPDKVNRKGHHSASVKVEPQSQKQKNIKKQKQSDSRLKDTKGISPKNKINNNPSPSLQPQSVVVQPKNPLGSQNGQQLGVENIFSLFQTLFNHQFVLRHSKKKASKRKNSRNLKQPNRQNQSIKLFACIMNEQSAKEIQSEKEHEKNKTQLPQKQQELSEQLFQVKNQESDDNISFPVNFTQSPSTGKNASIKLEKIVEEKHQPKIKTQQGANKKPFIFKDNFATVSEITNTEPIYKNQTFTEQLSVKYKMSLICSFDDVLNLIKKHLSDENNLKQIPFSNKKGKNQKIVLESNNLESESNKANDKKTVFFVVEKHNARLSLDLAEVWKKKMIKKPKRANKNRREKKETRSEDQSQKGSEFVNTLVQESIHLFPVDIMLLHGLFGNFQNIQMSIFLNQILTKDLSKYDNSQYHFFSSLFPRLIDLIEIDSKTKIQLELNSKYSQSSRKSGNSKAKTSKSLIHLNKKNCKHELCSKMTASDKAIVQNIIQMLSMNKSYSGLEMENKFYRKQIIHDCESILQLFAIKLSGQQKNNDSLGLSQKSFKHTFLSLIYKNLRLIMAQNMPSCFYSKILICIARVFSILSYEVKQIKTIDKNEKNVKNENKPTNPKQLISIGSNFKRHPQSKPSSIKSSKQIQLNTPIKIPNSIKFTQIHTSPFQFDFSDQDCYDSKQNSSIQSLNSSGMTEFDRNTSDFTSFITKVLPEVDVQKHQRNFRKNYSPFFSHDNQKGDISFGSSLKQYSQNKNHYQKDFTFDNDDTESGMNFSYPSSHSVLVNNQKQTDKKSQQNSTSLKVPNSLQASTNQKKTSPNSEFPRIFNEMSSSRCSQALTDDQLKEQMIEMLQQWIADDLQIDNHSRLFR